MKLLRQPRIIKPYYDRVREWGKLVSIIGGAQVIVQIIGLVSGILIIRLLPTKEYALYTLVNTMLGTMTVLADGGIALGVLAEGGKVWLDREKLGSVMMTGLKLTKKFALVSLLVVSPALIYLLRHHEASWLASVLITLSLIPAFYASLSDVLLEVAPKLRQQMLPLHRNQVEVSIARLILTGLSVFIFPFTFIAVLANGIPRIWANIRLKKISEKFADLNQKSDPKVEKEIYSFVKKFMPGAIYYCVSGQITIWVISIFGTTEAVADIGALGRIAMMLTFFAVLFSHLIIPRFARLPATYQKLKSIYLQIHLGLLLFGGTVVGLIWIFSTEILWVLGKNYAGLEFELFLNSIGSCIGLIAGLSFHLYSSRGWAINPMVSIPINVAAIALGIFIFDISSLLGVLKYNIFLSAIQALVNGVYGYTKVARPVQDEKV